MDGTPLVPTPGHTVGPFFGFALPYPGGDTLAAPHHPAAVRLHGVVSDGNGDPIPDALIEIWQADEAGRVPQRFGSLRRDARQDSSGAYFVDTFTFTGFGRAAVDNAGEYAFQTVLPGPTEPGRAAFFCLTIFARGLMNRLFTRAYVPVDEAVLRADRFLASVPDERRSTLLASVDGERSLRFDIRLQGAGETVFISYPGFDSPQAEFG